MHNVCLASLAFNRTVSRSFVQPSRHNILLGTAAARTRPARVGRHYLAIVGDFFVAAFFVLFCASFPTYHIAYLVLFCAYTQTYNAHKLI